MIIPEGCPTTISVELKSGEYFADRNIPSNPLGEKGFVGFWAGKVLRMYNLEDVKYYEFGFEPSKPIEEGE